MVVRASISQLPIHGSNDGQSKSGFVFNVNKTPNGPAKRKFHQEKKTFTELWMRGFSIQELADVFEVDYITVRKWRDKLKLPSRKPGYYKREDRVRHMATQVTKVIGEGNLRPARDIFLSWAELNSAGRHTNGTDKETNHHYGDAYDDLFRAYDLNLHGWYSTRDQVRLMMEIGVADGSSLCAWSEIFPNATCVGLDVHPISKRTSNVEFHLGDQRSRADCDRAAAGRQFDFIVEDATHKLENTLLTLFWLWPYVKPGGLYVVEEWDGVLGDLERIKALFPDVDIVNTTGPSGGVEPLVVFRKLPC